MRARKRILNIRKQSRIAAPKENLWFYTESHTESSTPVSNTKPFKNDRFGIFNDDYTRYAQGNSGRSYLKNQSSFVVDWQLSDTL